MSASYSVIACVEIAVRLEEAHHAEPQIDLPG